MSNLFPWREATPDDPRIAAMVQRDRELRYELLPTSDSPIYDDVIAEARARDGLAAQASAWLAEQTGGAR